MHFVCIVGDSSHCNVDSWLCEYGFLQGSRGRKLCWSLVWFCGENYSFYWVFDNELNRVTLKKYRSFSTQLTMLNLLNANPPKAEELSECVLPFCRVGA